MSLLPYVRRKFFASPPATKRVGADEWNDTLEISLGTVCDALAKLAIEADRIAYFTASDGAAIAVLTGYARTILAAEDAAGARALLGALAIAGGTMSGALNMGGTNTVTGLATPSDPTDAANKAYVDALAAVVSGALVFKGAWDASAGSFPTTTGRKVGWFYKVSVAGTVNGVSFSVGDDLFAVVDNASGSTYASNWLKIEGSITLAEIQAAVGFTFGSLAAASSITASQISDASANGRGLITAADYAAMKTLLAMAAADITDASANGRSLLTAANYAAMKSLLAVAVADITDASANGRSLISAANYAAMRTLLGLASVAATGAYSDLSGKPTLGTAAAKDFGTSAGNLVEVQTGGKLPALDASNLTNVPSGVEATDAQMWAETSTSAVVTPRRLGSAKAWVALTDASTIVVDSTLGRNFKLASMAGNRTLGFPSGTLVDGDEFNFLIKQDGTGSRTLNVSSSGYKHDGDTAFVIGTTANKYSLFTGKVLPGGTMILLQLVAVNFTGP